MNYFSLFFFFGFFVYLLMGFYALRYNPVSWQNRFFLILCFLFAVLSLENYFTIFFRDVEDVMLFHRVILFLWCLFGGLMVHFFMILTRRSRTRMKWVVYTAVYIPGLVFALRTLQSSFLISDFFPLNIGWAPVYRLGSPWFWAFQAYYIFYFIFCFYLVWVWGKKSAAYTTNDIRFENLFEQLPSAVFVIRNEKITFANTAMAGLTGFSKPEMLGKEFVDFIHPEHYALFMKKNIRNMKRGRYSARYELKIIARDGKEKWIDLSMVDIVFEGERSLLASAFDVTGTKNTESLLRISEQRYRAIIEDQTEMVCRNLPDGTVTFVNDVFCRYFGKSRDDLAGRNILDLVLEEDRQKVMNILFLNMESGPVNDIEFRAAHVSGEVRWQRWTFRVILDGQGKAVEMEGIGRDITELKKTSEQLQNLYQAVEQTSSAVVITGKDGVVEYVNPKFEELTGFMYHEIVGGGHLFQYLGLDQAADDIAVILEELRSGSDSRGKIEVRKKNGDKFWLYYSLSPVRESGGLITHYVAVGEDVTRRRKFEEEMFKVNKLDSLVLMAGGIGHDLNNILTALTGNLSLAKLYVKPDDKLFGYLTEAENAVFRARDLSWQFLTFSKDRKADRKISDIGSLIRETAQFALRGKPIAFKIYVPENLWKVEADQGQISQVIDNIVINAGQAMPDGGMLQIKCDNVILSRDKHYLPLKGGRYVKITVRDTGTGISAEDLPKIFDPYFTTKDMGHGLGLTICYSIVKKHDGHISVESSPGVGTVFIVYLPASD